MPESVDSRFLVILSVFSTVICITQDNPTVIVTPIPVPSFTLSDLFITPTNTVIFEKESPLHGLPLYEYVYPVPVRD
jgi:hypothetical protein